MTAAEHGQEQLVTLLLEHGAPWNALDQHNKCAGNYATDNNHQRCVDLLVDAGVKAELILGCVEVTACLASTSSQPLEEKRNVSL